MITDTDVIKLKEVFATKDDLNEFKKVFATKDELAVVASDVADLKVDSKIIQDTLIRLEKGVDETRGLAQKMVGIAEGLGGRIADLDQENKMGARTLHRHGIQIQELAKATGTTLSQ